MAQNPNFKNTLDSNKYFQTLPSYVREAIKQSNVQINNEEELKTCAENLMEK